MKPFRWIACLALVAAGCSKDKPAEPPSQPAVQPAAAAAEKAPPPAPAVEKAPAAGPSDPEIAPLFAQLASCDENLKDCPASAELKKLANARNKDEARKLPTWMALIDCIEMGNSAQRYACVMAAHFELYPAGRFDDPATGARVLAAAKAEKARYPNQRLGEMLAGWQESEKATALHPELLAFLSDPAMPLPARVELVRLSSKSMARAEHLDALHKLLSDEATPFDLRSQITRVLFRVTEPAQRERFEAVLLGQVANPDGKVARAAAEALGQIGGAKSFQALLEAWKAQKAGAEAKEWASSTATALRSFLERQDSGADRAQAYDAAAAIAKDASIPAFWRGSAILAMQNSKDARARKDLEALAKGADADLAKRAADAVTALDKAAGK